MEFPGREIVIGLITATLIVGAWHRMLRSRDYEDEPGWIRWAWTIVFWAVAVGFAFLALSL